MTTQNINQHRTQTTGLGVMISWCSLIANMGDLVRIWRMLPSLFKGTRTKNYAIIQLRHNYSENQLGKTKDLHFTVILGVALHKVCIEKEG